MMIFAGLIVERPQRSVSVVVGPTFVGNHTGYLGHFEGEITHCLSPSGILRLNLTIDAKPGPTDGLEGTADLILDEVAIGGWGGIGGHVRLESRHKAWLVNPHVQHSVPASLDVRFSIVFQCFATVLRLFCVRFAADLDTF